MFLYSNQNLKNAQELGRCSFRSKYIRNSLRKLQL